MQPVSAREPDAPAGRSSGDNTRLYVVPVVTVALLTRLSVVAGQILNKPPSSFYGQATEMAALATSVVTGLGLSSPFGGTTGPSAFLAPGYPLLVAAIFRLFGSYTRASEITLVGIQVLFGVTTVLLMMLVSRRLFGNEAGNIAGTLWAISPAVVWLPTIFWETSFSCLALVATVYLCLRCIDEPSAWRWIVIGIVMGLALLVNPTLMIALVSIVAWAAWTQYGTFAWKRSGPAIAILACVLVFAPWPVRNLYAMHAFIPLRTNMGYEIWQGNRHGSNGFFSATLHPNVNKAEFERYASLGELAYMREKSDMVRIAIEKEPIRFMRLTGKRIVSFWSGINDKTRSFLIIAYVLFTTLLGMTGLGLLARRREPKVWLLGLPLLLFPLPYYITHPDPRFRLVIDPLAALLSAYALVELNKRIKRFHS